MSDAKALIRKWYETYAPDLDLQQIPDGGIVRGPIEPLNPFGLQYSLELSDGSIFPRHQSGPGVSISITDWNHVVLKRDFRTESQTTILKAIGGFTGHNRDAAKDLVEVYNRIPSEDCVVVTQATHLALHNFLSNLVARECAGWELGDREIRFIDRPTGWPNIRICSVMGYVEITEEEFFEEQWPHVIMLERAEEVVRDLGDENAVRLIRKLQIIASKRAI